MDEFLKGYIDAALFSTNDESAPEGGEPLDKNCGREDIAEATLAQMAADCESFKYRNPSCLIKSNYIGGRPDGDSFEAYAGHDFWMTSQGHGCGFWDGDWKEPVATELTEACKKYSNFQLYVGDDGKIYH